MTCSLFWLWPRGLKAKGHRVRLVTAERYRPFAEQLGLDFYGLSADPLSLLQSSDGQAWLQSDQNPIALITNLVRLGKPTFATMLSEIEAGLAGSELILYSLFGSLAFHLAEKWQIPAVMVHLQPIMGTTADFPAAGSPVFNFGLPPLNRAYNRFSYKFVEQVMWQPFRSITQNWRVKHLGLPKERFWGPYAKLDGLLTLHAYSPTVVPPPNDWPTGHRASGYWFLPPNAGWQPPDPLAEFLKDGPPPIYIGFGSMVDSRPAELTGMIIGAIKALKLRCVLSAGWADLNAADLPNSIYLQSSDIPHAWLFERMVAVVHHGGAGTTAAGLRAGKPSFVIPYFADQHFWASRVAQLGAGPPPVRRSKLSLESLTAGLRELIFNESIGRTAAKSVKKLKRKTALNARLNV